MGRPPPRDAALGAAIRQLREERGITQEGLAHSAHVTTGTLSAIERGRSNPTWATVTAIAKALDVSMRDVAVAEEQHHGS
jgi:DNA-binding XRE family transcriptional regulator